MNTLEALPIDTDEICQTKLDIDEKVRSNLFQWNGQFSPQFIEALLDKYAKDGFHVLDPFMGSGTVLYECARLGMKATGIDVNPAAYNIAKTYQLSNITSRERKRALTTIENKLFECLPIGTHFFSEKDTACSYDVVHEFLISSVARRKKNTSEAILLRAFTLMIDKPKLRKQPEGIIAIWNKFKNTVLSLPASDEEISVNLGDCRYLPLKENSVDLVITSPPYINVFNYHQQYRKNTESLGWNVLEAAKSEFGSNRKHRQNRFLTAIQYCLDISQCLVELIRVCKENARIVFVVGKESNIRGTALYNGRVVTELAIHCGMTVALRQERTFQNKFGQHIVEDILHLTVPKIAKKEFLESARIVAKNELENALNNAADEIKEEIQEAIEKVVSVMPSQPYNVEGIS